MSRFVMVHCVLFCSSVHYIPSNQSIPSWRYLISTKHYTSSIYYDKRALVQTFISWTKSTITFLITSVI